jgi:hypothetical protein
MRMSCNSTYLLDRETDHGLKADELVHLLDELLEEPGSKAVVFSQWVRTHEIIIRRLQARGWGHVLFHGGVPSGKRQALVDRFIEDRDCRVFLSTDAGGVGLNLQQAAAVIVNMDLPWNPAVLEQRIGRVYRLGQTRSVQVINFVAQGTIEEGMLSVLAFKKSLFAGVLDGGENEIFMNGTRLSKFMESVEEVTGSMGKAVPPADKTAVGIDMEISKRTPDNIGQQHLISATTAEPVATQTAPAAGQTPDPWAALLDVGLRLVEGLTAAGSGSDGKPDASPPTWMETDPATGESYIKLPVPDPATVQRLADTLSELLAGLRR